MSAYSYTVLSVSLSFLFVPGHPISELELKGSQSSHQKAAWQAYH